MSEYPFRAKDCSLLAQGRPGGSCGVNLEGEIHPACSVTLGRRKKGWVRRIQSILLSRPENYLSIYQSGCNFSCKKCHSWEFSKRAAGEWCAVEELVEACRAYEKVVTLFEPRAKSTSWHAADSCRCCGLCILKGERPPDCPNTLSPAQIRLSPQGYGPARNIAAFTGGDLTCRPEFYLEFTRRVKERTKLWVLIETNGWGLTPETLDKLRDAGADSFWLDIKAFDDKAHEELTGCTNRWILDLPGEMLVRNFVVEVLSLYIPGLVETDQLEAIAKLLARADEEIPFTILAFFPEYRMKHTRPPNTDEMLEAYAAVRSVGLKNVRLGNIGVFARGEEDRRRVIKATGRAE